MPPYEPNDYEQMMLAAGWVTMGDLDPAYQRYLDTTPVAAEYRLSYPEWRGELRHLEALGRQFDSEVAPFYRQGFGLPYQKRDLERRLLSEIDRIEYSLGY